MGVIVQASNQFSFDNVISLLALKCTGRVVVEISRAAAKSLGGYKVHSKSEDFKVFLKHSNDRIELTIEDVDYTKRQKKTSKKILTSLSSSNNLFDALKSLLKFADEHSKSTNDSETAYVFIELPETVSDLLFDSENATISINDTFLNSVNIKSNNLKANFDASSEFVRCTIKSNNLTATFPAAAQLQDMTIKSNNSKVNILRTASFDGVFDIESTILKSNIPISGHNKNRCIKIKSNKLRLNIQDESY